MTDFAAVDAGDARDLVAMMDATDAWPAVRAARAWVLEQVALDERSVVVDAGCGPGTFGASASGCAVDVDRSLVMLHEARRRRADARVVLADVAQLPLRDGVADLVRIERVLQWADDPATALLELRRVAAPGGWLAVTDTDWGTFTVDHPDPAAARRLADAALEWVPHARLARDLPIERRRIGRGRRADASRHGDDHGVGSRRSRAARRPTRPPAPLDRGCSSSRCRRHRRRGTQRARSGRPSPS